MGDLTDELNPDWTWEQALAHTLGRVLEVTAELDVRRSVRTVFDRAQAIHDQYRKITAHQAELVARDINTDALATGPAGPVRLTVIPGGRGRHDPPEGATPA